MHTDFEHMSTVFSESKSLMDKGCNNHKPNGISHKKRERKVMSKLNVCADLDNLTRFDTSRCDTSEHHDCERLCVA